MKIKSTFLFKAIAIALCFLFTIEQSGFAQVAGQIDIAGHLSAFRNTIVQDRFRPLHLRYLQYDAQTENFKVFLDKGNLKTLSNSLVESSTQNLLKYFFIGITLPNDTFWVNLRPDAEDNIIDPLLGSTDIGKILLESDVQLKKDTAKFTSPQTPEGKEYWDKLYQKAAELYGSQNVTIPTLTRPWIVPGEIIIGETSENAYIYKARLKVMLEDDYLKGSAVYNFSDPRQKELNEYASNILREKIIPKITQEVNTSKRYALLRQVYYSLILAQWFKQRFAGKSGTYSNLINRKNLKDLTSKDTWTKTTYFNEYQKSFKDGEYNFKVSVATPYGQVMRSYFSGGIKMACVPVLGPVMQPGQERSVLLESGETLTVIGRKDGGAQALGTNVVGAEFDSKTNSAKLVTAEISPAVPAQAQEVVPPVEKQGVVEKPTSLSSPNFTPRAVEIIDKAQRNAQEGKEYSYEQMHEIVAPLLNEAQTLESRQRIYNSLPFNYRYHFILLLLENGKGATLESDVREIIKLTESDYTTMLSRIKGTQLEKILRALEIQRQAEVQKLIDEANRRLKGYSSTDSNYSRAQELVYMLELAIRAGEIMNFVNKGTLFVNNGASYHVSGLRVEDIAPGRNLYLWPGVNNAFGSGVYSSQLPLLYYAGGEGLGLDYNVIVIVRVPIDPNSTIKISQNTEHPYLNLHSTDRAVILKNVRVRKVSISELENMGALGLEKVIQAGKDVYIVEGDGAEFDENYQNRKEYQDFMKENNFIRRLNTITTTSELNALEIEIKEAYIEGIPERISSVLTKVKKQLGTAAETVNTKSSVPEVNRAEGLSAQSRNRLTEEFNLSAGLQQRLGRWYVSPEELATRIPWYQELPGFFESGLNPEDTAVFLFEGSEAATAYPELISGLILAPREDFEYVEGEAKGNFRHAVDGSTTYVLIAFTKDGRIIQQFVNRSRVNRLGDFPDSRSERQHGTFLMRERLNRNGLHPNFSLLDKDRQEHPWAVYEVAWPMKDVQGLKRSDPWLSSYQRSLVGYYTDALAKKLQASGVDAKSAVAISKEVRERIKNLPPAVGIPLDLALRFLKSSFPIMDVDYSKDFPERHFSLSKWLTRYLAVSPVIQVLAIALLSWSGSSLGTNENSVFSTFGIYILPQVMSVLFASIVIPLAFIGKGVIWLLNPNYIFIADFSSRDEFIWIMETIAPQILGKYGVSAEKLTQGDYNYFRNIDQAPATSRSPTALTQANQPLALNLAGKINGRFVQVNTLGKIIVNTNALAQALGVNENDPIVSKVAVIIIAHEIAEDNALSRGLSIYDAHSEGMMAEAEAIGNDEELRQAMHKLWSQVGRGNIDLAAGELDAWGNMQEGYDGKGDHKFKLIGAAKIGGEKNKEFWVDEKGNLWIFKENPYSGESYRPLGTSIYYKFLRNILGRSGEAYQITLPGKGGKVRTGTIEKVLFGKGAEGIDWSKLSEREANQKFRELAMPNFKAQHNQGIISIPNLSIIQIHQVLEEMVVDWLFSNQDSHMANFLIDKDGNIIGIDKEQVFKYFPGDRLDLSYLPNGATFTPLSYYVLRRLASEYKLSIELIDPVLKKIENIPDTELENLIRPLAEAYVRDHPDRFKTPEDFIKAFLKRKHDLRRDFQTFFNKVNMESLSIGKIEGFIKAQGIPDFKAKSFDFLTTNQKVEKLFTPSFVFDKSTVMKFFQPIIAVARTIFNPQPEINSRLSNIYEFPSELLKRIQDAKGDPAVIISLIEEYFNQLAQTLGPQERERLEETKQKLIERVRGPPEHKTVKLKAVLRLLTSWISVLKQQKIDYHRLYLARDGGFFHLVDKALGDLEGQPSVYDAGSSVYHLSRARMSGESSQYVYKKMQEIIGRAVAVTPKDDIGQLYKNIRAEFRKTLESDPTFRKMASSIREELLALGYGDKEKIVIVDTGFLGTIPLFIKNILEMGKEDSELVDESGQEKIQIAIIQPSSISAFAKALLGFDVNMFSGEERRVVERLASEVGSGSSVGGHLEAIEYHPIEFNEDNWRIERVGVDTQLKFFFEQVIAAQMVVAFYDRMETTEEMPEEFKTILSTFILKSDFVNLLSSDIEKYQEVGAKEAFIDYTKFEANVDFAIKEEFKLIKFSNFKILSGLIANLPLSVLPNFLIANDFISGLNANIMVLIGAFIKGLFDKAVINIKNLFNGAVNFAKGKWNAFLGRRDAASVGKIVAIEGLRDQADMEFGPDSRYAVKGGRVEIGDLSLQVKEADDAWFKENGIKGNGVVLLYKGELIIVLRKNIGLGEKKKALLHEFIAALALSGGTSETQETALIHHMADGLGLAPVSEKSQKVFDQAKRGAIQLSLFEALVVATEEPEAEGATSEGYATRLKISEEGELLLDGNPLTPLGSGVHNIVFALPDGRSVVRVRMEPGKKTNLASWGFATKKGLSPAVKESGFIGDDSDGHFFVVTERINGNTLDKIGDLNVKQLAAVKVLFDQMLDPNDGLARMIDLRPDQIMLSGTDNDGYRAWIIDPDLLFVFEGTPEDLAKAMLDAISDPQSIPAWRRIDSKGTVLSYLRNKTKISGAETQGRQEKVINAPLSDPQIINPDEINNIIFFVPIGDKEPKLGETVIDSWPFISGLLRKFPKAKITLVTDIDDPIVVDYLTIFDSENFKGRVNPVIKNIKDIRELIEKSDADMVFSVSRVPTFMFFGRGLKPNGKNLHLIDVYSPAPSFSAMDPKVAVDERKLLEAATYTNKEGQTFVVGGFRESMDNIRPGGANGRVRSGGIWGFAQEICKNLGLPYDLDYVKPSKNEIDNGRKIIRNWYELTNGASRPFDPTKKIFVINLFAVTQRFIISDYLWVEIIKRLLKLDAYFVFTGGGPNERNEFADNILNKVRNEENKNKIILPQEPVYPIMHDILGVADWMLTIDTGLSHLGNGVYNVPTSVITRTDILHWLTPRDNTFAVNVEEDDMLLTNAFYLLAPAYNAKSANHFSRLIDRQQLLNPLILDDVLNASTLPNEQKEAIKSRLLKLSHSREERIISEIANAAKSIIDKTNSPPVPSDILSGLGTQIGEAITIAVPESYTPHTNRMMQLLRINERLKEAIREAFRQRLNMECPLNDNNLSDLTVNSIDAIMERLDREYNQLDDDSYEKYDFNEKGTITLRLFRNEATGEINMVLSNDGFGIPAELMEGWVKGEFRSTKYNPEDAPIYFGGRGIGLFTLLNYIQNNKLRAALLTQRKSDALAHLFQQGVDGARTLSENAPRGSIGTDFILTIPKEIPKPASVPDSPTQPNAQPKPSDEEQPSSIPAEEIDRVIDGNESLVKDIVRVEGSDEYAIEFRDGTSVNVRSLEEMKKEVASKMALGAETQSATGREGSVTATKTPSPVVVPAEGDKTKIASEEISQLIKDNPYLVSDIVGLMGSDEYSIEFLDGTNVKVKDLEAMKKAIEAKNNSLGVFGIAGLRFNVWVKGVLGMFNRSLEGLSQKINKLQHERNVTKQFARDASNEKIRDAEFEKIMGIADASPAFRVRMPRNESPLGSVRNLHRWNMYFRDSRNVYVIVNNVLFADIQNLGIAYQFLDRNPDYNAAVDYIVPNPDQDGEAIDGKVLVVFKDGTQVDKVKYSNIESVLSGKISSAPISTQGPGGIDFRVLPITTQPAGMTVIQGKMIAGKAVAGIIANDRLDGEWKDIEDMLNGDIMPSVERIKEYLSLSCKTKDCQARINQVLNGVAEMFRLEEERSSRTDAALKQLLVLLESERPANELESGLAKINVAPGEVQAIEK